MGFSQFGLSCATKFGIQRAQSGSVQAKCFGWKETIMVFNCIFFCVLAYCGHLAQNSKRTSMLAPCCPMMTRWDHNFLSSILKPYYRLTTWADDQALT